MASADNKKRKVPKGEELELTAEKKPRVSATWLEHERSATKLYKAAPSKAADGIGEEPADSGKKKLKHKKKDELKKAKKEQRKAGFERVAHAEAVDALKGKAKGKSTLSPDVEKMISKCPATPEAQQRLLASVAERIAGAPNQELEYFDVFFAVHQKGADKRTRDLALLSAIAVMKDLVPAYKIRQPTEAEKSVERSRTVISLEKYELSLLQMYRRLLPILEAGLRRKPERFVMALSALVKCAADFNYGKRLVSTTVRYANEEDEGVRRAAANALQDMLQSDQRLDASKDVVVAVGHLAQANAAGKAKRGSLHVELLDVLLKLKVGQAEAARADEQSNAGASEDIRNALAESALHRGAQHLEKAEATLLYEVFVVYLRILRQRHIHGRAIVNSALIGLARWGQHVNLELLLEIIAELKLTVRDATTQGDNVVALQGINCALALLSGPSQALVTDATWVPEALNSALATALPCLHGAHSESASWPPDLCYELPTPPDGDTTGCRLERSAIAVRDELEARSVPTLVLRCMENALRCPHGFGQAADGLMAAFLEMLFALATAADPHVGLAILRDASNLLKRQRRLHSMLDAEGGLFGLGGVKERAVSVAWPLQTMACSISPAVAKIGSGLAEAVLSKRALITDLFPSKDAKAWLESEFPQHLASLSQAPRPLGEGGDDIGVAGGLRGVITKKPQALATFTTAKELAARHGGGGSYAAADCV